MRILLITPHGSVCGHYLKSGADRWKEKEWVPEEERMLCSDNPELGPLTSYSAMQELPVKMNSLSFNKYFE